MCPYLYLNRVDVKPQNWTNLSTNANSIIVRSLHARNHWTGHSETRAARACTVGSCCTDHWKWIWQATTRLRLARSSWSCFDQSKRLQASPDGQIADNMYSCSQAQLDKVSSAPSSFQWKHVACSATFLVVPGYCCECACYTNTRKFVRRCCGLGSSIHAEQMSGLIHASFIHPIQVAAPWRNQRHIKQVYRVSFAKLDSAQLERTPVFFGSTFTEMLEWFTTCGSTWSHILQSMLSNNASAAEQCHRKVMLLIWLPQLTGVFQTSQRTCAGQGLERCCAGT